jgi:hypothetical protein
MHTGCGFEITELLTEENKLEAGLRVFVRVGAAPVPVRPDD